MHEFIINASIQLIPVVTDKHPYQCVDEAIEVIQQSGIKYEVGAFSTVVEGTYSQVFDLINRINERLFAQGCAEWITNLQIQIRSERDITGEEKTQKFK